MSRKASKTLPVAAGTQFWCAGLMKGFARLGWFRSRLGIDAWLAGVGDGLEQAPGRGPGARRVGFLWRQWGPLAPRPQVGAAVCGATQAL